MFVGSMFGCFWDGVLDGFGFMKLLLSVVKIVLILVLFDLVMDGWIWFLILLSIVCIEVYFCGVLMLLVMILWFRSFSCLIVLL